jgi:thiamine-phosphate diphosphorylase
LAAKSAGADYLGSGAVFGTQTKADATTMSLPLFRKICRRAGVPVVAIGGIDRTNITKLKGCGMAGFAVVSGIFGAEDIAGTARELRGLAEHILAPN